MSSCIVKYKTENKRCHIRWFKSSNNILTHLIIIIGNVLFILMIVFVLFETCFEKDRHNLEGK